MWDEGDALRTVFLAKLIKTKGVDVAAAAVARANAMNPGRRVMLDVYGGVSAEYEKEFADLTARHSCVSYRGVIPEGKVPETLSRYHFMVFPTRFAEEVFPGVVLDSFSVGLPVLISDWNYNRELVLDGVNGFVLSPLDVERWAEKLRELSLLNAATWGRLSLEAARAARKYDSSVVVGEFLKDFDRWYLRRRERIR